MLNPEWGLMVWTLVTFAVALFVLWKYAFGPLERLLEARRRRVQESMDAAEQTRAEAQRLLEEYKETLARVRAEAEEILARSRATGEAAKAEMLAEARAQSERLLAQAREQIERDTRAAMRDIRAHIADLTALATERVVRVSLGPEEQRRLVEEALAELEARHLGGGDGA